MVENTKEVARKLRAEYLRKWRAKNPEKVRAAQERYWMKKASEIEKKAKEAD